MAQAPYFTKKTFDFLRQLKKNNERDWFKANKDRYEAHLKQPMLRFIEDFAGPLSKVSRKFDADPSPVGGSLFRIYRDTRFGKDKTPYKTHLAAHFRHRSAKDVHAPGFYLHLEPKSVWMGVGIWRPDTASARRIREAIAADSARWKKVTRGKAFASKFELTGDALKRPPRGFDPEHAFVEDLKRKDFIGMAKMSESDACKPDFLKQFAARCKTSGPFVHFVCDALDVPF